METRRYSKQHEWAERSGSIVTVGITDYAQAQLGDVVFVETPAMGAAVTAGSSVAVVESVKAASEVYAPVSGTVVEINEALAADPSLVNGDPEGGAWFFKLRMEQEADWAALLDHQQYEEYLRGLTH